MSNQQDTLAAWVLAIAALAVVAIVAVTAGGAAVGLIFAEPMGSFALLAFVAVPWAARRIWAVMQRRED